MGICHKGIVVNASSAKWGIIQGSRRRTLPNIGKYKY